MNGQSLTQFQGLDATGSRLAVTAGVLVALVCVVALSRRLRPKLQEDRQDQIVDVSLTATVACATLLAGWVVVVLWGLEDSLMSAFGARAIQPQDIVQLIVTFGILAGAYVATGFLKRGIDRLTETRETLTRHQSEIIYRVTQLSLYVVAVIVVLGLWNADLGGLLVGAGFLGIVVGMAARQTLGALLAGFVLMFSRPFEIGDWIQIDDKEGIVTDISIVNTRIQTFDGEYVMIPNDIVSGSKIVNRSRKGRLRIQVDVGVDYDSDPEHAADVATDAMKDVEEILTVPVPQVVMKSFGDSAIVLGLRFWIDKPSARRKWRAQTAVISAVKAAFDREGIKIPFPQREVMGREETSGFRVSGEPRIAGRATSDGGEQ